jgi:hypothetical protein
MKARPRHSSTALGPLSRRTGETSLSRSQAGDTGKAADNLKPVSPCLTLPVLSVNLPTDGKPQESLAPCHFREMF